MRSVIVFAALALSACSMAQSSLIGHHDEASGLGCRGALAAYYLPKTYFKIKVDKVGVGATAFNEIAAIEPIRRPDRNQGYCLDYLASATADETMSVTLDENFLLQSVASEAVDQSGFIIKTLIGGIFQAAASVQSRGGRAGAKAVTRRTVFEGEWDPVNPVQSAVINAALKDLGFCILTETVGTPLTERSVDAYCNNPLGAHRTTEASGKFESAPPAGRPAQANGVMYRPRVPHAVYLFINPTPLQRGSWSLGEIASVALENDQPIVSVGVNRSFFATRKTALVFDQGALKNICIHKTSELLEVSTIPLSFAKNLVALPGNVIQLKLENTNNHASLVAAETQLIKVQDSHLKALKGAQHNAVSPAVASAPPSSAVKWETAPERLVKTKLDDPYTARWNAVCNVVDKSKSGSGGPAQ